MDSNEFLLVEWPVSRKADALRTSAYRLTINNWMAPMKRAAWVPGWYELDPPLSVGLSSEFAFWRVVPDNLVGPEALVVYNTLWHPEDAIVCSGTIAAIYHPVFGAVQMIDTRGIDYTITLNNGTQLLVNAEEQPGKLFERANGNWTESSRLVSDWRFVIEFESLTEPRPA
jgi:hypothetical protein